MTDTTINPWVILVTRSEDKLGEPIVGIPRIKSQLYAHKPGRLRRFATRELAEAYLRASVDRKVNRVYTVTTLP